MATDSSIGGLYMRLGLSLDELETDFIAAERTTRANLNRLNRESNLIRLRAEVEIGNLDPTADAMQILTIRENALNQQMQIQRDRIRLADAALQDLIQRHGQESVVAQRAATALERERLALQRLEREFQEVTSAQDDFNNSNDSSNSDGGLGDLLENLSSLPVGKMAIIAAGLEGLKIAADSVVESTEEMLENFRELQNQSYELNLPVAQTKELLRQLKLGGGDIGDFEGYIRGITDAWVKGEKDDPEMIALDRYGAKIVDATGKLKDFKEITEEVYQAFKKAKAEGNEIEFLQLTGGEAGVRDAIQFFERYEDAKKDAAKVYNSGVNPQELHELDRALNLLDEQTSEFKDALANIFTPALAEGAKSLFDIFHSGTEFLVENKTEFQSWGFVASEAVSTVLSPLRTLKDTIAEINNTKLDFGSSEKNQEFQKFIDEANKTPLGSIQDFFYGGIIERATENQIQYNNAIKDSTASWAAFREEEIRVKQQGNPLSQYDIQRINQYKDELEDLKLAMQFGDDKFSLEKAQNDLWLDRAKDVNYLSREEEEALEELHAQKMLDIERRQADELAKIQEESAERTKNLMQSTADIEYGLTHSAFEKQLYDIERWKDAQLEKADTAQEVQEIISNAAMKESEAFMREMDKIQGKIESAQDRLMRLTSSQKDYDLYKAQKQYQQDIKDGIPQGMAQAIYDATVRDINERTRNDKSGSYTKSKGSGGNPYFIEFGAPKQTDWANLDPKSLAFDQLSQGNRQLAESTKNLIGMQNNLSQAINKTADEIQIIEGDRVVSGGNNFDENPLVSVDDVFQRLPDSTQKVIDAQSYLTDSTDKVTEKMNAISDNQANQLNKRFDTSDEEKFSYFTDKLKILGNESESVATVLQNTSNILNEANEKIAKLDFKAPINYPDSVETQRDKNVNTALDVTQPEIIAAGTVIDMLSEIAGRLYNFDGLKSEQGISAPVQAQELDIQPILVEVQAIRGYVEKIQPQQPNVTVSPNINIDLGGAYVFDNDMRRQLTEDVKNEVVNAVTDAVQTAKKQVSYNYGN